MSEQLHKRRIERLMHEVGDIDRIGGGYRESSKVRVTGARARVKLYGDGWLADLSPAAALALGVEILRALEPASASVGGCINSRHKAAVRRALAVLEDH